MLGTCVAFVVLEETQQDGFFVYPIENGIKSDSGNHMLPWKKKL
jgi:hypothetical protein